MISFIINALKIIIMLGFLVFIHEGGHFLVAKFFKIKVNEFAIGFGPTLYTKKIKETKYAIRSIPLGGFVNLEGEEEPSNKEGSFSNTSTIKKIAIVAAGAIVNILFGITAFFILAIIFTNNFITAITNTNKFIISIISSITQLFTGGISVNDMTGIVGISDIIVNSKGIAEYIYILSLISVSLGITNLMPFPPLDGGKIIIYFIEAIIKRPLNEKVSIVLQNVGFYILIAISIYVTYNDVLKIF